MLGHCRMTVIQCAFVAILFPFPFPFPSPASDHIAGSEIVLFSCLIIRNFPSKVFIVHHRPLVTPEGSREP